jgi:AAA15 family ATPase/GTPase
VVEFEYFKMKFYSMQSIKIKRYRCFEDTSIQDLGKINLFGGRNNVGKTALLEAIFLLNQPSNSAVSSILRLRQETAKIMTAMPSRAWNNLFLNHKKELGCEISAIVTPTISYKVRLSTNENATDFIDSIKKNKEKEEENALIFADRLSSEKVIKSSLTIEALENEVVKNSNIFVVSPDGVIGRGAVFNFNDINFITANAKNDMNTIAEAIGKSKLEGTHDILLAIFKTIDDEIEAFDTITIGGEGVVMLKIKEKPQMPLTMFGDALYRTLNIALHIINHQKSIILIDEIENGIFHENQENVWEMLFKLANRFDVQIFATSHSAEMIKAFQSVVQSENFQADARYFKLERHAKTDKIIANKIPIDVLDTVIQNNIPYRGEVLI